MTSDERLAALSAKSSDEDVLLVELVYRNKYATFDVSTLELQHLPLDAIIRRYFVGAFAAIDVPTSEQQAPALTAPSATNV